MTQTDTVDGATIAYMIDRSHKCSVDHGWWEDFTVKSERNLGEAIALMHSEVTEAMIADDTQAYDDKLTQYLGVEVELADIAIRIFDTAGGLDIPVVGYVDDLFANGAAPVLTTRINDRETDLLVGIHVDLSLALEGARAGRTEQTAVHFARVINSILGYLDHDRFIEVIEAKMAVNDARDHRHGGKQF